MPDQAANHGSLLNALDEKGYSRPKIIQFETTNLCNAKCVFCPHKDMKRKKGVMPDEVFDKLLDDMRAIRPELISPFLHGEMFLDSKILDRLEILKQEFPDSIFAISTNAHLLDEDNIRAILGLPNLDLTVSLNAVDEHSYNRLTGLNGFEEVRSRVRQLIAKQKEQRFNLKVSMINFSEYTASFVPEFKRQWGDYAAVMTYDNYAGLLYPAERSGPHCKLPIASMFILWNGDVSLCCKDMEGEIIFGNIMEKPLIEIWDDPEYVKYRFCSLYDCINVLEKCSGCDYR